MKFSPVKSFIFFRKIRISFSSGIFLFRRKNFSSVCTYYYYIVLKEKQQIKKGKNGSGKYESRRLRSKWVGKREDRQFHCFCEHRYSVEINSVFFLGSNYTFDNLLFGGTVARYPSQMAIVVFRADWVLQCFGNHQPPPVVMRARKTIDKLDTAMTKLTPNFCLFICGFQLLTVTHSSACVNRQSSAVIVFEYFLGVFLVISGTLSTFSLCFDCHDVS